jgi:heat shock protein HslJ
MKTHQRISFIFILFVMSFSCKQTDIVEPATSISTLIGKWKLIEILKGDIIDKPCGVNTLTRDITLEFTTNSSGTSNFLSLNGQSTVNDYSGGYSADSEGNIKIPTIGGTKRGGSQEMMECEDNYYKFLTNAQSYRIIQIETIPVKTVLELGVFRDNPKDKGTYLIFEKIN